MCIDTAAKSVFSTRWRTAAPDAMPIAWFYAALFLDRGMATPFIPLWFQERGLSAATIALALALPALARAVTGPLIGLWVDRFSVYRNGVTAVALGTAAGFGLLAVAPVGWPLAMAWFIVATTSAASLPLIDVVALHAAATGGPGYGGYRGFGSAVYAVGSLLGGVLLRTVGVGCIVGAGFLAALAAAAAARRLPAMPAPGGSWQQGGWAALRALFANRAFVAVITTAGLIEASHAFFYGFSTLQWRAQGIDGVTIGALWAVCVAAEIVFLTLCERWWARLGDWRLLALGGAASALRWVGLSCAPPVWVLFPLQAGHALSYTATFVAALRLVKRLLPVTQATLGQSVCAALANGFAVGGVILACGGLVESLGGRTYLVMALLAVLGLGLALRGHARYGGASGLSLTPVQVDVAGTVAAIEERAIQGDDGGADQPGAAAEGRSENLRARQLIVGRGELPGVDHGGDVL